MDKENYANNMKKIYKSIRTSLLISGISIIILHFLVHIFIGTQIVIGKYPGSPSFPVTKMQIYEKKTCIGNYSEPIYADNPLDFLNNLCIGILNTNFTSELLTIQSNSTIKCSAYWDDFYHYSYTYLFLSLLAMLFFLIFTVIERYECNRMVDKQADKQEVYSKKKIVQYFYWVCLLCLIWNLIGLFFTIPHFQVLPLIIMLGILSIFLICQLIFIFILYININIVIT